MFCSLLLRIFTVINETLDQTALCFYAELWAFDVCFPFLSFIPNEGDRFSLLYAVFFCPFHLM